MQNDVAALKAHQLEFDEKFKNLFMDIHAKEPYSVNSRLTSLEQLAAKYKYLVVGGVAVMLFLQTYGAIKIDNLAHTLAPIIAR